MQLLDIVLYKLDTFVDEIVELREDERFWDLYLHKAIFAEGSFLDWKNSITKTSKAIKTEQMTKKEVENTVQESQGILNGFIPKE